MIGKHKERKRGKLGRKQKALSEKQREFGD
jgi:hypothetical protein